MLLCQQWLPDQSQHMPIVVTLAMPIAIPALDPAYTNPPRMVKFMRGTNVRLPERRLVELIVKTKIILKVCVYDLHEKILPRQLSRHIKNHTII